MRDVAALTRNSNTDLARIVRTLLTHQGKRQQDLADALGIDVSGVSRSLAGKRDFTYSEIGAMAEFFAVSPVVFYESPESLVRSRWFRRRTDELLTVTTGELCFN